MKNSFSAILLLSLLFTNLGFNANADLMETASKSRVTPDEKNLSAFNTIGVLSQFSGPSNKVNLELSEDKKLASIKFQGFNVTQRFKSSIELIGAFDSNSPTSTIGTNESLANSASITFGLDYIKIENGDNDRAKLDRKTLCKEFTGATSCTTPQVKKVAKETFEQRGTKALCTALGLKECKRAEISAVATALLKQARQRCNVLTGDSSCDTREIIEAAKRAIPVDDQARVVNCAVYGVVGPCNEETLTSVLKQPATKMIAVIALVQAENLAKEQRNQNKIIDEREALVDVACQGTGDHIVCDLGAGTEAAFVKMAQGSFESRTDQESAFCSGFNVKGDCTADSMAAGAEKVFAKLRGPIAARLAVATVIPFKLTVGRQKYDYRDIGTLASASDTEDTYAASISYGKLFNNYFVGVGVTYEESFSPQPSRQLCNPTVTPANGFECFTGSFGAPTSKDTYKIALDVRKRFGDDKGFGFRLEHDEEEQQFNIEVPIYFIATRSGLSTGLKLTWNDADKDLGAAVFVGTPLTLF